MKTYIEKYLSLSDREKGLLVVSVIVVFYLLFSLMLFSPMDKRERQLEEQLNLEQQQIDALSIEMARYAQALISDPDAAKKVQLQSLKQQLESLDKGLVEASVGLIAAEQLPKLLQDVLQGMNSLTLIEMKTLPVDELLLAGEQIEEGLIDERERQDAVGVFKHGVEVVFDGEYFDVVAYLKLLETLKWRFYWELLDYQVQEYPSAKVTLRVYTLSTETGIFSGV